MKIILFSFIVVAIIGLMVPSAFAQSEIPNWIKNNAGWWANEEIDDNTFVKGIEFMLDNLIIQIPPNQKITVDSGLLKLDKFYYELPRRPSTTDVIITGQFENFSGNSVSIEIIRPDGKIENISTRSSTGNFNYAYVIKSDFPFGEYQISAETKKNQLEAVSFKLSTISDDIEKTIPNWIKNNAGWWANGEIDDNTFVSGLKFLIQEGIIKVEKTKIDKSAKLAPDVDDNLIMYETKLPPNIESFSVILVNVIHDNYCSPEENKKTAAYGKMAEHGLKKNLRDNTVHILAVCMKIDEIKESTYPLVLQKLGANKTNMMIFVGDVKANFESYKIKEAVGWWKCQADYSSKWAFKGCGTHLIVVCDECKRTDIPNNENVTARGMETLIHEIGHHNLFEANFGPNVFGDSLHNAQAEMDYCLEGGTLRSDMCTKLLEHVPIMGETYTVMNINYLKNNWKEIDKIAEESKITNWIDCKISNYEKGVTGSCVFETSLEDIPNDEALPSDNTTTSQTITNYKTYTDTGILITSPKIKTIKFTIEYPDYWTLGDRNGFGLFYDQTNCSDFRYYDFFICSSEFDVFWNQDDFIDNRSETKILQTIEKNALQSCVPGDAPNGFGTDVMGCHDFEVLDSTIFYTYELEKVYYMKIGYTVNSCSGMPHGEECEDHLNKYEVIRTVGLIFEGHGSWKMVSQSNKHIFDQHSYEIIHMMQSFSLK